MAQERIKATMGRPPKYTDPNVMQLAVDKYFEDCKGVKALDVEGNPIVTNKGYLYTVDPQPLTMTGLALALGFADRCSLLDYRDKNDEFYPIIRHAKSLVEHYAESRLFDKDGQGGAKFWLSCNGNAWVDKQNIDITSNNVNTDTADMSPIDRAKMIQALLNKLDGNNE